MKLAIVLLPLLAAARARNTPVQQVVELLQDMLAKSQREARAENANFAAFSNFCSDQKASEEHTQQEEARRAEQAQAKLDKAQAAVKRCTAAKAQHDTDIQLWQWDREAAAKVRAMEHEDYLALHRDYSESVEACEGAVRVLKAHELNTKQTADTVSLVESLAASATQAPLSAAGRASLLSIAQAPPAAVTAGNAYNFKSHSVVEMLYKLKVDFMAKRDEIEQAETAAANAFERLDQQRSLQIKDSTQLSQDNADCIAEGTQAAADASAALKKATRLHEDSVAYLNDLMANCARKTAAYGERKTLRQGEEEAIQEAIRIMTSEAVTGHSERYLPQPVGPGAGSALAQLRSAPRTAKGQVLEFLQGEAAKLHSSALATLAMRAGGHPFAKVRGMIRGLISRLQAEAATEADHKSWCDGELAENERQRNRRTEQCEGLHADVDLLAAKLAQQQQEQLAEQEALATLTREVKEAGQLREADKKENLQTIADGNEAIAAVKQAMKVLSEFYGKAADATAFSQQRASQPEGRPETPEIFTTAYKGLQAENGGVMSLLEVVLTDFSKLVAETSAQEATDAARHGEYAQKSAARAAEMDQSMEDREAQMQEDTQSRQLKMTALEGRQRELGAGLDLFANLRSSCLTVQGSLAKRSGNRAQEIASLQQALSILRAASFSDGAFEGPAP